MLCKFLRSAGVYSNNARVMEFTDSTTKFNPNHLLEASDGSIYVFGNIQDDERFAFDAKATIIKFNADGSVAWAKRTANATGLHSVNDAVFDPSENLIVAMNYYNSSSAATRSYTVKITPAGAISWQKYQHVGDASATYPSGVAADASGNVFTLSSTNREGAGGMDMLLTKYNSSGTLQWDYTLGSSGDQYGAGVTVDSAGDVIVIGTNSGGTSEAYVAKYSTSGTVTWQKKITATGGFSETFYGVTEVVVDGSDNILISRTTPATGITRLTSSGTLDVSPTLKTSGGSELYPFYTASVSGDRVFYVTNGVTDFIMEWDIATGEIFYSKLPDTSTVNVRGAARSPDGSAVWLGHSVGRTTLLRTRSRFISAQLKATPNATQYTLDSVNPVSFTVTTDNPTVSAGTLTSTAAVMTTVTGSATLTDVSVTVYPFKNMKV